MTSAQVGGLLLGLSFLVCPVTAAQQPVRRTLRWLDPVEGPALYTFQRGDTLIIRFDSAFVFNRLGQELNRTNDSLIKELQLRIARRDSIRAMRDSQMIELQALAAVHATAYDSLRERYRQADSLLAQSTANTDRALAYSKKVRAASYLTAMLVGGVTGGFGFTSSTSPTFNPLGFAGGAALGLGVTWLVNRVIR